MKRCKKIRKWIALSVSSDLTAREAEEVEAHLGLCERCCRLRESFSQDQRRLNLYRQQALPEDFWQGYWEEISARLDDSKVVSWGRSSRILWRASRYVAAASIVLVLLYFYRYSFHFSSSVFSVSSSREKSSISSFSTPSSLSSVRSSSSKSSSPSSSRSLQASSVRSLFPSAFSEEWNILFWPDPSKDRVRYFMPKVEPAGLLQESFHGKTLEF